MISVKRNTKLIKKFALILIALVIIGFSSVLIVDSHVVNAASKYIIDDIKRLGEVDAVIVLGAYVFPDGTPSLMLKDRLDTGLEVFNAEKTDRIIVTGDHGTKSYDEVNGMRQYIESKGVERGSIFMDHAGFNTYDSMYRARDVFLVKKAVIVTQEYHLSRAIYIARVLGIEAYGICADKRPYANMEYHNARETLARVKDFFQVNMLHTKPKFLGDPLPVWDDGRLTDDGKS